MPQELSIFDELREKFLELENSECEHLPTRGYALRMGYYGQSGSGNRNYQITQCFGEEPLHNEDDVIRSILNGKAGESKVFLIYDYLENELMEEYGSVGNESGSLVMSTIYEGTKLYIYVNSLANQEHGSCPSYDVGEGNVLYSRDINRFVHALYTEAEARRVLDLIKMNKFMSEAEEHAEINCCMRANHCILGRPFCGPYTEDWLYLDSNEQDLPIEEKLLIIEAKKKKEIEDSR